jgi:hypothetical protein
MQIFKKKITGFSIKFYSDYLLEHAKIRILPLGTCARKGK